VAKYRYAALTSTGEAVTGVAEGSTAAGVAGSLAKQGLTVQRVAPERRKILQIEITPKRVKPVELSNFSRQMAAFVAAGVPILDGLNVIESETTDKVLRRVVGEVSDSLRFGEGFSEAMASHANAFPPFYIAVLRSAESTGDLAVVLSQLALYIERDMEAKRRIRSALVYPVLVTVMSMVTVAVLTIFVLPRFKTFFESFNAKLPLATRMLIASTNFLGRAWPVIAALFVAFIAAIILMIRTTGGRQVRDTILLRVPILGEVVRFTVIERFCRVLTSMVQAGVPIPESLRLASTGANNFVFQRALERVRDQMLEGEGISAPLARTGLFPGTVTQMVRVGEETGTLDDQLVVVASYYEKELEYKLKRLTNLFEPICVIVVGVVVGFVAIALVSAIYGIYNQVDIK
jgi:type IV pilus assembly protein PilC